MTMSKFDLPNGGLIRRRKRRMRNTFLTEEHLNLWLNIGLYENVVNTVLGSSDFASFLTGNGAGDTISGPSTGENITKLKEVVVVIAGFRAARHLRKTALSSSIIACTT